MGREREGGREVIPWTNKTEEEEEGRRKRKNREEEEEGGGGGERKNKKEKEEGIRKGWKGQHPFDDTANPECDDHDQPTDIASDVRNNLVEMPKRTALWSPLSISRF